MEYSRIVAVTGMPGLYEIVSSKSDGAIVRSLEDGATKFVSSRVHNLSHLESIEIYTSGDNVSLGDVFVAMKSSTEATPDVKDNKALKSYFEKVYPQLDTDRVYTSDMKKMVNWFAALEKHNIDFTPKEETEEEEPVAVEAAAEPEPVVAEAPAKKAKTKKAATEPTAEAATEEAPAEKKAPAKGRKKKTEE